MTQKGRGGGDVRDKRAVLADLRRTLRALESPAPRWGAVAAGPVWPQGFPRGAVYEAVPAAYLDGPAAAGFAAALAAQAMAQAPGGALCVAGPGSGEFGAPYGPGLKRLGLDPSRVLFAKAQTPEAVFAVLEEAAHTPGLSAVFGLAPAKAGEATARRLQRAAETAGAFVSLWRPYGAPGLSGVRGRFVVAAAASAVSAEAQAFGLSGRAAPPGTFTIRVQPQKGRNPGEEQIWEWRDATHGFHRPAVVDGGTLASPHRRWA